MITETVVTELADDDKLLRYMGFEKFLRLVHNKKLYFPRADCFDDKLEGYYTKQIYEISKAISVGTNGELSNKGLCERTQVIRESAYISCWTKFQHESMAHWEMYGGKNSVAIMTSVGILKNQLKAEGGILCILEKEIVAVEYIDHHAIDDNLATELLKNARSPLKKKNVAFRYEEEVRVIYSHHHQPGAKEALDAKLGKGFDIDIEPNKLILKIFVSPKADNWFHTLVVDLMEQYRLSGRVEWSRLHLTPSEEVFSVVPQFPCAA